MGIIDCIVIGDAAGRTVKVCSSQILCRYIFSCCRFYKRRSSQEDGALFPHYDALISHGRHIRASRCAGTKHHSNLRYSEVGHVGLIVKNLAKMVAVRENLSLAGQVGSTTVHKINARQSVLLGNPLGSQVLGDSDRVITASLHCSIIRHHHTFHPTDPAHTSDNAPSRNLFLVIECVACQLGELEEGGARVQEQVYSLPCQQLPLARVPLHSLRPTALHDGPDLGFQLFNQGSHSAMSLLEAWVAFVLLCANGGGSVSQIWSTCHLAATSADKA